jgi:hypothetical protein
VNEVHPQKSLQQKLQEYTSDSMSSAHTHNTTKPASALTKIFLEKKQTEEQVCATMNCRKEECKDHDTHFHIEANHVLPLEPM